MKTKLILSLLAAITMTLGAQAQATFINEDFNTNCPNGYSEPGLWSHFNTTVTTPPEGSWTCGNAYGRSGTPGISCTGYFGSPATVHSDTAILISPQINLLSYTDSIYLNFDTKTTRINLGAKLQLIISSDTSFTDTTTHPVALRNVFDSHDSADWVTHQANLTEYKYNTHFYVGFRYTSEAGTTIATRWYLDNVRTTTTRLDLPAGVRDMDQPLSSFRIAGTATTDKITIAYNTTSQGIYTVSICDITGRVLHSERIQAQYDNATYNISGLQLGKGLYIVRMGNETGQATAKALVQ